MYNDEDDRTSIPKLERRIDEDRKRIEREKEEVMKAKKRESLTKVTQSPNVSKRFDKVEASAKKFKDFIDLEDEVEGGEQKAERKGESSKGRHEKGNERSKDHLSDRSKEQTNDARRPEKTDQAGPSKANTPKRTEAKKEPVKHSDSPSNQRQKRQSSPVRQPESEIKRRRSPPPPSSIQYKPFNKLLEGVVFAISGIQVLTHLTTSPFP